MEVVAGKQLILIMVIEKMTKYMVEKSSMICVEY